MATQTNSLELQQESNAPESHVHVVIESANASELPQDIEAAATVLKPRWRPDLARPSS
jgi:hypothetical protein